MNNKKIDPITRSITVTKKLDGVYLTKEGNEITFYRSKNHRKILSIGDDALQVLLSTFI